MSERFYYATVTVVSQRCMYCQGKWGQSAGIPMIDTSLSTEATRDQSLAAALTVRELGQGVCVGCVSIY